MNWLCSCLPWRPAGGDGEPAPLTAPQRSACQQFSPSCKECQEKGAGTQCPGSSAAIGLTPCASHSRTQSGLPINDASSSKPGRRASTLYFSPDGTLNYLLDSRLSDVLGSPAAEPSAMDIPAAITSAFTSESLEGIARQIDNLTLLGSGSSGVVFRANWNGAAAAVKFMLCESPDQLASITKEGIFSKLVGHPHVAQSFAVHVTLVDEDFVQDSASSFTDDSLGPHQQRAGGARTAPAPRASDIDELERNIFVASFTATASERPSASQLAAAAAGSDHSGQPSTPTNRSVCGGRLRRLPTHLTDDGFENNEVPSSSRAVAAINDVVAQLNARPGMYLVSIVMEYCDRGSLLDAIRKGVFELGGRWGTRLPLRALLRTAREVAQGMAHLHAASIIHGDLKTNNILLKSSRVDRRGFVAKVADFSLSTLAGGDRPAAWSTANHMAPEVLGSGQLDKAADVYSFGVALWEMCTGQQPFAGLNALQVIVGIQNGSLALEWPQAPLLRPLVRLGRQCLAPDPADRPRFDQIVRLLNKIETHVRKNSSATDAAAPTPTQQQQQQQLPKQQDTSSSAPPAAAAPCSTPTTPTAASRHVPISLMSRPSAVSLDTAKSGASTVGSAQAGAEAGLAAPAGGSGLVGLEAPRSEAAAAAPPPPEAEPTFSDAALAQESDGGLVQLGDNLDSAESGHIDLAAADVDAEGPEDLMYDI